MVGQTVAIEETDLGFVGGRDSSIVEANGDLIASMSSCDGRPVTSMILSSWFIVDVPAKSQLHAHQVPETGTTGLILIL